MEKNDDNNPILEQIFETPSKILEKGIDLVEEGEKALINKKPFQVVKEYINTLGPGITTGASDDDPSGIGTYSQTGATYGFQLLWLSWFTFPLMSVVQEMCARIGIVTGHGLAANIKRHYSRYALYVVTSLLFIANTFNIGADLGAMGQAVQLIIPKANFALVLVAFGASTILLQVFTTYARYARYLKYFAMALLAYVFSALMMKLNWSVVFQNLITPTLHFNKDQILLVCAILGTTISPYLFFWQTSQEVEERNLEHKENDQKWHQDVSDLDIKKMRTDVWSGMFFSNVVMFFIMASTAGALYLNGVTNITSAAQAAAALRPFAGDSAFILFALGIIGTGMLAIPVLAGSTSYALAESFDWKHGLYRKLKEARAFYGVIIVSVIVGILLNFVGLDSIKALIYSATLNGIIAPVVLVFIVGISSNKLIMRNNVNKKHISFIGWLTVLLMALAGIAAIISLLL